MEYVILDLEWNGAYSNRHRRFINEIIEFGAVKTDAELNILDTFQRFVKPEVGKKLGSKVRELTNISNEELSTGSTFMHVTKEFTRWLGKNTVLMTWGSCDILTLLDNFQYFARRNSVPFMKQYVDLQSYIQKQLGVCKENQLGLLSAAGLLSIPAEESAHHRAFEDSMLAFNCLRAQYDNPSLKSAIQTVDREFYKKMTFKTLVLCDLQNPLVDRSVMVFDCETCGRRATKKSEWVLKNKIFHAQFHCGHCGVEFYGKIQFRLKYEGLHLWKKAAPLKKPLPDSAAEGTREERKKLSRPIAGK